MSNAKFRGYRIRISASLVLLSLLACTIPFISQPTPTVEISDALLTEAAQTIEANIRLTRAVQTESPTPSPDTATPTLPPTSTPSTTSEGFILPTETQPAGATEEPLPTATQTPRPTATPSLPATAIIITLPPTPALVTIPNAGFTVKNTNIFWCSGIPWAIFRVYNSGKLTLESLWLSFFDATAGQMLYGPLASDLPFMSTDKTCHPGGIARLAPGNSLYLGNTLTSADLKGHQIRATIILCSLDGLGGTCYSRILEFAVP